jgi:putative DeoR family transcriptional regulator (stage III sporulation protein D)
MRGNKREQLEKRAVNEALFFINNKSTIRETAKQFGVSKSVVHRDFIKVLPELSYELYKEVSGVIKGNTEVRHLRGGESTKIKYKGI